MEATKIFSMETLITALNNYMKLNGSSNLNEFEEMVKKDYEIQIKKFLSKLENYAKLKSKDSKPNYSLEVVSQFIKLGCSSDLFTGEKEAIHPKYQAFSEKLSELMKEKGVKSKEVIEATGINQAVFSKAKVGLRKPSKELLDALSTYFKYDFSIYK